MSDVQTDTPNPSAGEALPVTQEDMISRGKGMSLATVTGLDAGSPAKRAWEDFKVLVAKHQEAEQLAEQLKDERNLAIYVLKSEHDVGFSAIADAIGATSSLALYLYERAQGKTAKQIREESQRSRAAKEQFRESDPDRKAARKQSPAERNLRKQQREALTAFLAQEKAAAAARGEESEIEDDELVLDDDDR